MEKNKLELVKPKLLVLLSELEEIIGKSIPKVEKINTYIVGVTIEGKKIVGLGLNSCGLTTIPEQIIKIKSLQKIYLFKNQITSLPEEITQLKKLKELNLGRNQLKSLPENMGNFKSLENVFLSYNQLSSLPESIVNLTTLKLLDLENNNITSLPESMDVLKENGAKFLI